MVDSCMTAVVAVKAINIVILPLHQGVGKPLIYRPVVSFHVIDNMHIRMLYGIHCKKVFIHPTVVLYAAVLIVVFIK